MLLSHTTFLWKIFQNAIKIMKRITDQQRKSTQEKSKSFILYNNPKKIVVQFFA